MTLKELDTFLHRYTPYEKDITYLTSGTSDACRRNRLSNNLDSSYEGQNLALTRDEFLNIWKSYLKSPKNYTILDEDFFIPKNEGLTFLVHPRFFNSADSHIVAEHRHNFLELVYVYSGSCKQTVNGQEITMSEGELTILDTNVLHSISTTNKEDILINCLIRKNYFDAAFFGRLAGNSVLTNFFTQAVYQNKKESNFILFHSGGSEMVKESLCKAMCEYFDRKMCSFSIIDSFMSILFSELLRVYKDDINHQNYVALKNTEISEIILYLEKNYKTATLESTARRFSFHPVYLSSFFKKLTGKRFIEFVQLERLNSARDLLESTDMPVEAIVKEVGYSNTHFFYQLFKKHYNMTPTVYRQATRSGLQIP